MGGSWGGRHGVRSRVALSLALIVSLVPFERAAAAPAPSPRRGTISIVVTNLDGSQVYELTSPLNAGQVAVDPVGNAPVSSVRVAGNVPAHGRSASVSLRVRRVGAAAEFNFSIQDRGVRTDLNSAKLVSSLRRAGVAAAAGAAVGFVTVNGKKRTVRVEWQVTDPRATPTVDHITLSPAASTIEAGGNQAYTIHAYDSSGNDLGDVTASSALSIGPDGSCATGSCTATVAGHHAVTATHAGRSVEATLDVSAAALWSLTLSPAGASTPTGADIEYSATGRDAYGNDLGDLTSSAAFTIAPDGSCTEARCRGTAAGPHTVSATVGAVTGQTSLTVTERTLTSLVITPASATVASGVAQDFTVSGRDATNDDLGDLTATAAFSISPDGTCVANSCAAFVAGQHTVTAEVGGITTQASLTVTAGPLHHLVVDPASATVTLGDAQAYTVHGADEAGNDRGDVTASVVLTISPDGSCSAGSCTPASAGVHTVTATLAAATGTASLTAESAGFDPSDIDPTVRSRFALDTAFLYTGPDAVQDGVAPGAIAERRAAVVRGRVLDRAGDPLAGVTVSVLHHPELGSTSTRSAGEYDLAVNGGGAVVVQFALDGYVGVQRQVDVPWNDYVVVDDVALTPYDVAVTAVDGAAVAPFTTHRSSPVTDGDGTRRLTVLVPRGASANAVQPDGTVVPIGTSFHIRATEFTVGTDGESAMPGELPPTSAYTFAFELSVDEAVAVGASHVRFDRSLVIYADDFLGFPVGSGVPTGTYDRDTATWSGLRDGRVVKVLAITGGVASLDVDGSGNPASSGALAALGITTDELAALGAVTTVGARLWRVAAATFSPCDLNWARLLPADSILPPASVLDPPQARDCTKPHGSTVACANQGLDEDLEIEDTALRLHYSSRRTEGYEPDRTLVIPVTPASIPPSLQAIEVSVQIGGRRTCWGPAPCAHPAVPVLPNQSVTFVWDGRDAYGRPLQGEHQAEVVISYGYAVLYAAPANPTQSWATPSGIVGLTFRQARGLGFVERHLSAWIGRWDAASSDRIGGWTVASHHELDAVGALLHLGDGTDRPTAETGGLVTRVIAGSIFNTNTADGIDARRARLDNVSSIAVAPDGSVYLADAGRRLVRRIDVAGIITTVAGSTTAVGLGDSGPATAARLEAPIDIALGPDGSLYIADRTAHRVRRVSPGGTITTVAGNGTAGFSGDGGPATSAQLRFPNGVAVGPDGSLYIRDTNNNRIRRVGPDGVISTVAGTGQYGSWTGFGDGGQATQARLDLDVDHEGIEVRPDGTVVFEDYNRVRAIDPQGVIRTVVGGNWTDGGLPNLQDGLDATAGRAAMYDIGLDRTGRILVCGAGLQQLIQRTMRVAAEDRIRMLTGTDIFATVDDGAPALSVAPGCTGGMTQGSDGIFYIASGGRIVTVAPALAGRGAGSYLIPSEGGEEVYEFDLDGRHLRTRDAFTGAVFEQFGYDAAGLLVSVTDGYGNATHIQRDGTGRATSIVSPEGTITTLAYDAAGHLATIAAPSGFTHSFRYADDGLMTGQTDARGFDHAYGYDTAGRLVSDRDAGGNTMTLSRTTAGASATVTLTSPAGQVTTFTDELLPDGSRRRTRVDPGGATTVLTVAPNLTAVLQRADGTKETTVPRADPRWGMLLPAIATRTTEVPGASPVTVTHSSTVSLATAGDPMSMTALNQTITTPRGTVTRAWTAATRRLTVTGNEPPVSLVLDVHGKVVSREASGVDAIEYAYDSRGRPVSIAQGSEVSTFGYDAGGRLVTATDALGTTTLGYGPDGLVDTVTVPGGRVYRFDRGTGGIVTAVHDPGGGVDTLTSDAVGDLTGFGAPSGFAELSLAYDADRRQTSFTQPDGTTVARTYDAVGRLDTMTTVDVSLARTYVGNTRRIASETRTAGGSTTRFDASYAGARLTSLDWSGAADGSFAFEYDNLSRVSAVTLTRGGVPTRLDISVRMDGALTAYGDFTYARSGPAGQLSSVGDTVGRVEIEYDSRAIPVGRTLRVNGSVVASTTTSFDLARQVTSASIDVGGVATTSTYGRDTAGRLTSVTVGATTTEQYVYDANGNRTSATRGGVPSTATYATGDRITGAAGVTYTVDTNGRLVGRGADIFVYDSRNTLLSATVGGVTVTYAYDGMGRRVASTSGGLTTRFLYAGMSGVAPFASVAPDGTLTTYRYDDANRLVGFVRGATPYYVLTDQVGSPLVVADRTGAIVDRIVRDAYGQVLSETAPAFGLPIGFAGGLVDPVTGFVRMGLRDYDPRTGRWTTPDPILLAGGSTNLYEYVANDPVSGADQSGLWSFGASAYEGVGGGFKLSVTWEGFSICGEIGLGVGGSVDLNPVSGLDRRSFGLNFSGAAKVAGLAGIGGEITTGVDSDFCGDWEGQDDFQFKGNLSAFEATLLKRSHRGLGGWGETERGDWNDGKGFLDVNDGKVTGIPDLKAGFEGKAAVKGCYNHII